MQGETQQQQPIYIQQIILNCHNNLIDGLCINKCLRIIQIVLSNNILCVINDFHTINFYVYNNTLLINEDIVYKYTFPKNVFSVSNNIIELLIQNIKSYNLLTYYPKTLPENISFDNILANTCSNYSFNVYRIDILKKVFNLPINILNFKSLYNSYYWLIYDYTIEVLKTNNLKKYHKFNYFKSIIIDNTHIITDDILDIIMKFL